MRGTPSSTKRPLPAAATAAVRGLGGGEWMVYVVHVVYVVCVCGVLCIM